jgi:hypothetical protein
MKTVGYIPKKNDKPAADGGKNGGNKPQSTPDKGGNKPAADGGK